MNLTHQIQSKGGQNKKMILKVGLRLKERWHQGETLVPGKLLIICRLPISCLSAPNATFNRYALWHTVGFLR